MKNSYDVIIVGSGAAGFSAADALYRFGVTDICVVTENINYGTSRNAGSDKQTYYKLDICSDGGDSVRKMAQDLFSGGSMNGSDALIQAAGSVRCFMRLVECGVPFPYDEFGRYAGYRTDHDATKRATSAGPLTSKYMTECLQRAVEKNGTEILDGFQVIRLNVKDNVCHGVLCLTKDGIVPLYAKAVVLCTGASAGMYSRSVYPACQTGATGLAVEAGAELSNYQEWQYGIASVKFRWNLSGSYQQVVPTYISVRPDGTKREFLLEAGDTDELYSDVFLKGYQWPFDSAKLDGSSKIDMLVFNELQKGNRVFLDYRRDPTGFSLRSLSHEAREYLQETGCIAPTPYERLCLLNPKAVKLYKDNGIDLEKEMLEISLCAQHNNGGIRTDVNGQSSVKNLFAAGEAAGKFGVYRPGGSALNDTQTGSLRIAGYLSREIERIQLVLSQPQPVGQPKRSASPNLARLRKELTKEMSDGAGVIRSYEGLCALREKLFALCESYEKTVSISPDEEEKEYYSFRLTVLSMLALVRTEMSSMETIGSRGGCICYRNGKRLEENKKYRKYITVTGKEAVSYVPVDEIPEGVPVFEKLLKG